jgi:PAS domain S-box-containing protein
MPASQDELVARLNAYQDKLEEAARQGARRFEEVFASPPAGVAVHEFDQDGIRRVNAEELRILGYAADQMLGHHIWEFVVMADASKASVQKKLAGEKDIKPFVRTFRKADGSGVAMLLVDRRLYGPDGEATGIRTAMAQISEE